MGAVSKSTISVAPEGVTTEEGTILISDTKSLCRSAKLSAKSTEFVTFVLVTNTEKFRVNPLAMISSRATSSTTLVGPRGSKSRATGNTKGSLSGSNMSCDKLPLFFAEPNLSSTKRDGKAGAIESG